MKARSASPFQPLKLKIVLFKYKPNFVKYLAIFFVCYRKMLHVLNSALNRFNLLLNGIITDPGDQNVLPISDGLDTFKTGVLNISLNCDIMD